MTLQLTLLFLLAQPLYELSMLLSSLLDFSSGGVIIMACQVLASYPDKVTCAFIFK